MKFRIDLRRCKKTLKTDSKSLMLSRISTNTPDQKFHFRANISITLIHLLLFSTTRQGLRNQLKNPIYQSRNSEKSTSLKTNVLLYSLQLRTNPSEGQRTNPSELCNQERQSLAISSLSFLVLMAVL